MRDLTRATTFDQYRGEDKFVFGDVVYVRKEFLGEGTTACVHCFHPVNSALPAQPVVVKVELPVKRHGSNRFYEGTTFLYEAYWNNQIYGLGVLSGDPRNVMREHYLLMPYFAGVLACDVSLQSARELVEWFILVANFIHQKMHVEKNAVHGDIKADNVIFQISEKRACVIDFGLTEWMGKKIGRYSLPQKVDLIRGAIKLSHAEYCPHTPPELFGREMVPAGPSQDAYGLGFFILSLLRKAANISSEQMTKLCFVIGHLRADRPQDRWPIPAAISKLHADFVETVPRPIVNDIEASKKSALSHQRPAAMDQDVSGSIAPERVSLPPLLTKAMANRQLRSEQRRVGSSDGHNDSGVLRLPSVPGALAASAAPAASSSKESASLQGQQVRRTSTEESGSAGVTVPLSYLFPLHGIPKQDGSQTKPAQNPDRRP